MAAIFIYEEINTAPESHTILMDYVLLLLFYNFYCPFANMHVSIIFIVNETQVKHHNSESVISISSKLITKDAIVVFLVPQKSLTS